MQMPQNQVRTLTILDLNDDCLREILEYSNLEDMSIVVKTCKRLKEIVLGIVSSQKNTSTLVVQSATHLERCIRDIGPSICSLFLKGSSHLAPLAHNKVLGVLIQCHSLTNLEMNGFSFGLILNDLPRVLFPRLQKLVLDDCSIPVEWLTKCPELVEVEMSETDIIFGDTEELACPNMSTLKIYADDSIDRRGLQTFLEQNSQIRTLHIDDGNDGQDNNGVVPILNFAPPSVESLVISYPVSSDLGRFHELKELRLIRIHSPFDLAPVLNRNATSLEVFELDERNLSLELNRQNVGAISRMKKLKKLTVYVETCDRRNFQRMINDLNELEGLRIGCHENPFDERDVLHLIQDKPNLQSLVLSFRYNGEGVIFPENRFAMNVEIYQKMLDFILLRKSGKSLHIVIIGPEDEISEVDASYDIHPSLQITRYSIEFITSVLNIDLRGNDDDDYYITLTDEDMKLLRSQ